MAHIKILQNVANDIIAFAKSELPIEACGYLAGNDGVISKSYNLTNIDKSPEHFSFDPKEQFATVKDARNNGLQIIANFHSHPETPARPSIEDIALAYDPNILYFIISFAAEIPDIKAFSIVKGEVQKIEIIIVNN